LLAVRLFGGCVDEETLRNHLLYDPSKPKAYALSEVGFANALKNLSFDNAKREAWLSFKEETIRQLREEAYAYGRKELKATDVRTRVWRLDLTDKKAKRLLDTTFRGEKAGGVKHIQTIMAQRKVYWLNGWIVRVDDGETDESLADLYVTPTLPASKVEGAKGFIDQTKWDYQSSFAVEVECYPSRHWDRLESNYHRNKKMGFPTVFIVPNQTDEVMLREKLLKWQATLVANSARFEPNRPEMVAIEVAKNLGDQASNSEPNQAGEDPTCKVEPAIHPIEPSIERSMELSGEEKEEVQEALDGGTDVPPETVLQGGELALELAGAGWWFRLKTSRGKLYLCARKGPKERCIGQFNPELQKLVEKNNITIKRGSDNTKKETL
ncbi:MAG: hypothetical protein LBB87_01060, partial [Nitrososphaerota archaeon]|nr:hypothetical protein [Nitrososphaerota archaeon]